jgi:pectinesterase
MKRNILIIAICLLVGNAFSQSLAGITGKPDTSFTTYSAWLSALKSYPGIKIVKEIHPSTIGEKRNITYCKKGKRKLLLDVFYPWSKMGNKKAAIIILYGGGWRSGNRIQHYPMAQHLAGLGYVCYTPEYRLSTEALYPAAVYDIKAALRWVKKNASQYNIDTSKITVLGFSAGGELAAFMGTTNGNPGFEGTGCHSRYAGNVQAIVDIDGILSFVHPESGEGDDSRKTSAATYWFGYSKAGNPGLWKQASPLTYAGKNTPPTLFINSGVARMHAGRDDYIKILKENNIYTEVKSFDNAPHPFCLFDPWFESTIKYIDEFLKKVFPK